MLDDAGFTALTRQHELDYDEIGSRTALNDVDHTRSGVELP